MRAPIGPALAAACALTLLAGGCAAGEGEQQAAPRAALTEGLPQASDDHSPAPERPADTGPAGTPAATEPAAPTLPPGDPGDEPPAELPPAEPMPVRYVVPVGTMLNVETVEAIAGGRWAPATAPAESCDAARPAAAVGERTVALSPTSEQPGRIVETVSTYRGTAAAAKSLNAVTDRLRDCGWQRAADPMVGEAAVAFTRRTAAGNERVVVLTAEGVTVTLIGSGAASRPDTWDALVDVAQGSSCLATRQGCH